VYCVDSYNQDDITTQKTGMFNKTTLRTSNLTFRFAFLGYYRVNYDENNWDLLINFLKSGDFEEIPPVNRAQLLDDSLNLARAGVLPYGTALDLAEYLEKEVDYIPWFSALTAFTFLNLQLTDTEVYPLFQVEQLDRLINFIIFIIFSTALMILKKELEFLTYEIGCLKHVFSNHDLRFCHGNHVERRAQLVISQENRTENWLWVTRTVKE